MDDFKNTLPNRIEMNYYDKMDRLTEQENAVKVVITEYDENNQVIRSFMSALSHKE
ncbi:MAG: hypothetical protein K0R78_1049 [Pelosinus sp.]|jgi:hypothetical protein|nr:hypothetical protein [Pelosinus sp.]